jgi:hypothetical protein
VDFSPVTLGSPWVVETGQMSNRILVARGVSYGTYRSLPESFQ